MVEKFVTVGHFCRVGDNRFVHRFVLGRCYVVCDGFCVCKSVSLMFCIWIVSPLLLTLFPCVFIVVIAIFWGGIGSVFCCLCRVSLLVLLGLYYVVLGSFCFCFCVFFGLCIDTVWLFVLCARFCVFVVPIKIFAPHNIFAFCILFCPLLQLVLAPFSLVSPRFPTCLVLSNLPIIFVHVYMPFCGVSGWFLAPPMSLLLPPHPDIIFVRPRKGMWGVLTTLFAPPYHADDINTRNVVFFNPWSVFFMSLSLFVAPHKCTTHRHMSMSVCAGLSSPHARALSPPPPHVCTRIHIIP